jgi:chromate transporter
VFTGLALRGFGGVLPWAQRVLVEERRWLTREQFVELLAFGQLLPGPNICNLALMAGDRWFGWRGALVALAGMLAAPAAVVLTIAIAYSRVADDPVVRRALVGMGAVSAPRCASPPASARAGAGSRSARRRSSASRCCA